MAFTDWESAVVYQVFPDRFRDAEPALTVREGEFLQGGQPVSVSKDRRKLTAAGTHQRTFYGGDLKGVREALPHLRQLGATVLYLNPIFASKSTHRYDTDDFLTVDPHLGTEADLVALAEDLHASGMALVLDGVFNHTSFDHPWYRTARDRHYCMVEDRPDGRTQTWMEWGVLPKLDLSRPEVQDAMLGVLDRWAHVADGWRLDAAHLYPEAFLRRLRDHLRAQHPGKRVIAEDWCDVSGQLHDGLYDGATNFLFRNALERFFARDASPETLYRRLAAPVSAYPRHGLAHSWNLLGNHDTKRFLDVVGRDVERMKLAVVLLFTLPGTPLVYQGDEVGMWGADEHVARSPMVWDRARWRTDLFDHYVAMARLRREHPVLVHGQLNLLHADVRERVLAFERTGPEGRAVVAIHDGFHPVRVSLEGRDLVLEPRSWAVLVDGERRG